MIGQMVTVHPRVREQMNAFGVDVVVLCGENNVAYATGTIAPSQEPGRAGATRSVALISRDEHVLLRPSPLDLVDNARELGRALTDFPGVVAIDEYPSLPVRDALRGRTPTDASTLLARAKIVKTGTEVDLIRRAQRINELAMDVVRPLAVPGASQCDLTSAFFRAIFELGATGNTVDPVWDIVPPELAQLSCTLTGHLPFPVPSADRVLADGDVIFNDTGIDLQGWASDFGRTWTVGRAPTARQLDQFDRWCAVLNTCMAAIKPGATAADVARAATEANRGERPWFPHLYVAHGLGTDSAELPFCGTDLGPAVEDQIVLAPGMVLVLEPVIWDDGFGGYRAEEIVLVTDDGCERLTDYTYAPYTSAPVRSATA
ncbi:MAG: Xaa-Pro aminopeptidase [Actinomycetia bacterium]|nr:Xaa-Pro aminopeptidase [Actinomycetes bacterium]